MGNCLLKNGSASSQVEEPLVSQELQDQVDLVLSKDEQAELEINKVKDRFTTLRNKASKNQQYYEDQAKKYLSSKNTEMCRFYLQLKVGEESHIKDYSKKITNIISDLDLLTEQRDINAVYSALNQTRSALHSLEVDMNSIEQMKDDIEKIGEFKDETDQINEKFNVIFGDDINDSSLEEEYEKLSKQVVLEDAPSLPTVSTTIKSSEVSSPPHTIVIREDEEEVENECQKEPIAVAE
ncbi:hypothetical protein WA158_001471 [Blastocystis sp. Blastoise]